MDNNVTKEWMIDFLANEGFKGQINDDGDVYFKNEGRTHVCLFDDKDPEYIVLGNYIKMDNVFNFSRDDINDIIIDIINSTKIGKISINNFTEYKMVLNIRIEMVTNKKIFSENFFRYLNTLKHMMDQAVIHIYKTE